MTTIVPPNRPLVGVTLTVNLYDVRDINVLSLLNTGMPIAYEIANKLNLKIVDEAAHQFKPYGYTIAFALAESHLTIYTYPEHQSCYIDIFCCNPNFDPINALNIIKNLFNTNMATHHIITR
jgi:S-adenosylmethionine decarboxylase proenzyme